MKDYFHGNGVEVDANVFAGVLGGSEKALSRKFKDLGIHRMSLFFSPPPPFPPFLSLPPEMPLPPTRSYSKTNSHCPYRADWQHDNS